MSFRITGLPAEKFSDIFDLSDETLAARGAVRRIGGSGTPCRISLTDPEPGEEVILTYYEHHHVDTPFRSGFAIYVRRGEKTYNEIDQVPEQLRKRMLAVRAYDETGMLRTAELVDGKKLEALIPGLFRDDKTTYLHVHFAKYGCYACLVRRA